MIGPRYTFHRRGFSLVELMIGTIILGLGLLMIGAVLPIAWNSSIETAAQTRADGATEAAKYFMQAQARVMGGRDLFGNATFSPLGGGDGPDNASDIGGQCFAASYSFIGDYFLNPSDTNTPNAPCDANYADSNQLVHALSMENWAVDEDSQFVSDERSLLVPEAPSLIDTLTGVGVGVPLSIETNSGSFGVLQQVGVPVVGLRDRLFPQIPTALAPSVDVDSQWRRILDERKIAWAVFHRILRVPRSPADARHFLCYYVTLRRGDSSNRYARQGGSALPPDEAPFALGSVDDVRFPIAWRVPIQILPNATGVPSIANVGPGLPAPVDPNRCNVADMFVPGAWFIDEYNGLVARVTQREFINAEATAARLTLDQSILPADLDLAPLSSDTTVRNVWVFPPPVQPTERSSGEEVVFKAFNPVINIRVEPLTIVP